MERGGLYDDTTKLYHPYILESFYYADADTETLIPHFGDFLLDSGAFTFMSGSHKGAINWNQYIDRYCDFINRNSINHFFQLDIDCVVGYEKVKEIRKVLQRKTGKQPIPVWHVSRGKEQFKNMCRQYPYVAIGGIVSKQILPAQYHLFPAYIDVAHDNGAKIHGLGFTNLKWLPKCKFDSVDSTAWTTGNRFGFVYQFDGTTMRKINAPQGYRLKDSRRIALINYTQWIKFQKYAQKNL